MIALGKEKEKSLVKQTTATQEAWVTTIFFWKTNYSSTADSHTLPEHSQHGPVRSKENWFSGPTCPLGVPSYGGPASCCSGRPHPHSRDTHSRVRRLQGRHACHGRPGPGSSLAAHSGRQESSYACSPPGCTGPDLPDQNSQLGPGLAFVTSAPCG